MSLFLSVFLMYLPLYESAAQSSRYRISTQADLQQSGQAPSFRGNDDQNMPVPPQGARQSSGGRMLRPNVIPMVGGGAGSAGDPAFGDAAVVSMGYQVHVLGEVSRPGTYHVAASERLSEVLLHAGGLAVNGSERNVELRHKGGGVQKVDLLEFSLFGRLENNPYVIDNDVIFVPLRSKVVQVVGAVKRPDVYEIKNERTLEDIIELAGGFNAATSMDEPVRVIRFKEGQKNVEEIPIEKGSLTSFLIQNGDVVVIPNLVTKGTKFDYNVVSIPGDQIFYPTFEDRVFVLGGIAAPGAYPFSPYYMVNQYISLAGGLSDRGVTKYKIITIDGKTRKARETDRVNPGDTIMIKEHWMSPAAWLGFALGIASFGLSASSTIIALRR